MTPQLGSVVAGRYRIEAELGLGGMGAVYRAMHLELGRPVALKMVLPDVLGLDEGLARFRREAQLAQKLEHPNTVRLYDFGQTEEGLPYIAFELLRGTPLDRAIQGGPMPPARVARIITQVLKALMEAHGLGIIHRDIKPANVFLCEFSGEQDFVKVLDFGIAKSTHARTLLTQAGMSPGTPNYMAPEQVRAETLSPSADLYSVGLMMAEMLTGRIVFSGPPTDIVQQHLSPQPVPLPPSLAGTPLWPVLVHATEKEVTRRYTATGDMLRDLDAIVRSGALEPGGSPYQTFRPASPTADAQTVLAVARPAPPRRSAFPVVIALCSVFLLGIVGVVVFTFQRGRVTATDDDDDTPKKKKKKLADKSDDAPTDTESVKSRLEKLGWKIISESTSKQPTMSVATWVAQKGSQTVSVYVYNTDDENVAKSLETSLSTKGSATTRVDSQVYWLITSPADKTLADDLLADVLR